MSKLGFFATITSIIGALTFATMTSSTVDAADACVHKDFKTELVKQACDKGGQKEAKDAMKAFMKEKKIKSCNQCHSKLAPNYELKKDGLDQFQKLGGKMLDGGAAPAKDAPAKDAPAKDAPAPKKP
jgi:hypothetical protein